MKTFFKTFAVALVAFVYSISAFAQKTEDYYKFDDNGFLCEFQLTLPDSTVVKYKHQYDVNADMMAPFPDGEYATINYVDGTVVDFSASYFNGEFYMDKFPAFSTIVENQDNRGYYYLSVNDWYKYIRTVRLSPQGPEMLKNMFILRKYTISLPDKSQLSVSCAPDFDSVTVEQYSDYDENGSYITWSGLDLSSIDWQGEELPFVDMATGEIHMEKSIVSGVQSSYDYDGWYIYNTEDGRIIRSDGSTFTGTFAVVTKYDKDGTQFKSNYLKNVLSEYKHRTFGFGDIIAIIFSNGNLVDKDNKIIGMYRGRRKLDEFDMESVRAAEQGKIDKAKADAAKAAKEKSAIVSKYGKKYSDAFFAGKVIVGMPWDLVQLGLDAHSFKDFYTALISIDRKSDYGHTQCYSLYGDNLERRGNIWVKNGVVESITLY
ncbi:MAG: hypothetical protein K6E37_07400 [Bacteroidales bacterium]|nr:hypothetical protein [Bacteroidales bacterium]